MENLVEAIQKNLGFQELDRVDPNTQEVPGNETTFGAHSLAQAAIPAILSGLYAFIEKKDGYELIKEGKSNSWMDTIFGIRKNELNQKISSYALVSPTFAALETEHIANEAVRLVREWISNKNDFYDVNDIASAQKQLTLHYLPASLQIGYLLGNNNLDDRTNKMEGPVSNLMHAIENQFNHSGEE
jgi:hypothetical protein